MAANEEAPAEKETKQRASTTYEDALAGSAQRIRDTAKWLVAAFAAVGGALIAGMQLKDLGALEGTDAALAAIGAALGIAGVVLVIACAAAILAAGRVPMTDLVGAQPRREDLRRVLQDSPNLYQPFDTLDSFHEALSENWREQAQAFLDYYAEGKSDDQRQAARRRYESAGRMVRQFNPLNRRLLATAEYENVRTRFDTFRAWIVTGVLVAALGAGAFAYASEPAEEQQTTPAVTSQPARGFLHLNEQAVSEFRDVLGKKCVRNIPVIALEKSTASVDVLTDPTDESCKLAHIEVSDAEGEVTGDPLEPFEPPEG